MGGKGVWGGGYGKSKLSVAGLSQSRMIWRLPLNSLRLVSTGSVSDSSNINVVSKFTGPRFIGSLLSYLNDPQNAFTNSEHSQRVIENIIFDEYQSYYSPNANKFIAGGIKSDVVNPMLTKYLLSKKDIIQIYANNLIKQHGYKLENIKSSDDYKTILIAKIITSLNVDFLHSSTLTSY